MSHDVKYQALIDPKNRNNSHTLALDFALDGAQRPLQILEVGCSAGYFGMALKQRGHHVTGVEMDETSARLAAEKLDEVFVGPIQAYLAQHPDKRFDVITFGDVLEHIDYPQSVLKTAALHLNEGGRLVCSVPNVGHASVRGMLMKGDWDYAELGILDRTHLRFFTKKTLIDMFQESGYQIDRIQAVRLDAAAGAQMCGIQLDDRCVKFLHSQRDDDTLEDFQYVLSACPTPLGASPQQPNRGKRTLRILSTSDSPQSSIFRIRLGLPLQTFAERGCRMLKERAFSATTREDVRWADVVVIQRGACMHARKVADWCQEQGKPWVYDIDDLLIELPDFLQHHSGYVKNKTLIESMIAAASAVTVTNRNLSQALAHLSNSIWLCPNYHAPLTELIPEASIQHDKPVHLILASSDRVRMDFIAPALSIIQRQYADRVAIVAIGPIGPVLQQHGVVCESLPLLPHGDFITTLARLSNPVGLIPLDASKFSSCKSSVKFLDYSQGNIVSVCSDVSPYKDDITHGVNGVLTPNTTEAWVSAIADLIDHPEKRRQLAQAARTHVATNHHIGQTADAWSAVFAALAPNDVAVALPKKAPELGSSLQRFKDFLRAKNHQRKARRRDHKNAKTGISGRA